MRYGRSWCEKARLIEKMILGKGHQMTRVLQPQRERGRRRRGREREREREGKGGRKKTWRNIMWATKMHRRLGTMMLRMTCVISFYYGNSYTHCRKSSAPSFPRCEETRSFYTETLLYRDAFTHRRFYTQTLLHTDAFTQRRFYTHRNFYTQTLLHTDTFTHRPSYWRSAPRYFLVCGLVQVKCLSQGSPLKHDGRRKTTKRKKNEQKGFKGSSTGPPGEEIPRVPLRDLRGEKNNIK